MADLLGSILGSMEKPPSMGSEERNKAKAQFYAHRPNVTFHNSKVYPSFISSDEVFKKLVPGTMVPARPLINGFITFLLTPVQQDLGDLDSLALMLI
ncbi:sperm-associated antigen 7 [Plakobranchus ocellatus]|uniref:Sperm-associated antigen 7 n=1 Tax=Plakobranchus ocellatus TaxID=259542 RepID=A0AAV4A1P5_9GAST|nr:sperm-associated antigen 7 [Plakobranchus ocellatus]